MNRSTMRLIETTVARWQSREALKHANTKLLCLSTPSHGVQKIVQYRPLAKQALLDCGCLRPIVLMTDKERQAFDEAITASQKRRLVRQSMSLQVFVEDEETA
jgi:hypothetical protein